MLFEARLNGVNIGNKITQIRLEKIHGSHSEASDDFVVAKGNKLVDQYQRPELLSIPEVRGSNPVFGNKTCLSFILFKKWI